jgi:ketosteroid isomerase-like protein
MRAPISSLQRAVASMALVAIVALGCACGHGGHPPAQPAHEAAPAEVVTMAKATVEQWRQGYELRGIDALAKLYAHTPETVLVLDGMPVVGWPAIEQLVTAKLAHAKEVHVRLKDVAVVAYAPTVAGVTATMTREIGDGVTTVTENGALSLVLVRDAEGWKIVAEHYSYRRPS